MSAAGRSGGSFLGTAAATAAGVVGGALLMNSFRGMFGGQHMGQSAFDSGAGSGSPWGGDASGSDLARDAGLNDIGGGRRADCRRQLAARRPVRLDSDDERQRLR